VAGNPRRNGLFGVVSETCGLRNSHRTGLRAKPGTEICDAETDPQKPANHLAEINPETRRECEKPPFRRIEREKADRKPDSGANSLLSGKTTGNIAIPGLQEPVLEQETTVPQRLLGQFPMKINRENMSMNREFFARNREFHLQTTPHEVFDRHRTNAPPDLRFRF
jgi:hypothetical protein